MRRSTARSTIAPLVTSVLALVTLQSEWSHRATTLVVASGFSRIAPLEREGLIRTAALEREGFSRAAAAPIDVTVTEGTSMSVSASPDGRTLAIDLQGSIWTLPAAGGAATRITDVFNDARQPAWSPDGRWIAFFGYRDGGYDLWAVAPDGRQLHKLTWGPFDDREPAWSHDGSRVAFSSDRGNPLGGDYNIWVLDTRTGDLRQLTSDPADDYMPSWSPDDREIAFASARDGGRSVWIVDVADKSERKAASASGTVDAPSWGPGGQIVYHVAAPGQSRLESSGTPLTGGENAFAFRASWISPSDFVYVSDGKIRRRSIGDAGAPRTIDFRATLQVVRPEYARRTRDFDSTTARQALGIVRPVISPDGTQVAFAALGDIYVMPIGGKPENVTRDRALDTDPAWSPDGSRLAYSSDRDSDHLQLWIRDMRTGQARQVTHLATQPQGATWSPDGTRIAFFNVTGMWRVAEISVLDVASGAVTKVHDTLAQPGTPTWSPDGARLALAEVAPLTRRFREGTNQILTIAASPASSSSPSSSDRWFAPIPMLSIDSRAGCGPVWSPDGTKMAAIYEGVLAVWPVAASGEPLGPPRRVTSESAHAPSWAGDSRHVLYQSFDKLRLVDVESGETREVPVDLRYALDVPKGRLVVHAGTLVDMKSPAARTNVDIIVEGNRIKSVEPHSASRHGGGAQVIDASNLDVMPGLVEFHSHLQPDFGEAQSRAWLAFGVTTVRSPGNEPYEAVEEREASESGVRPGPRVYGTGYLMEWMRVYYKMGIAISSPAHFEMELQRAKVLQHDLIKSYVRLPDLQQRRMVEFAHAAGVPVATHEIYPAALVGVDNTEHTAATSRRGYSPKIATLQRSYEDVIQLFGKSGRTLCPMISGAGTRRIFEREPELKRDPRFALYPTWIQQQVAAQPSATVAGGADPAGGSGKMVMDVMRAGGLIVAGTDTPNAINLHGELMSYTMAGMTPYEALKTATVNPAQALLLDAGTIEAGKLADLVIVDGNPLDDIANAHKVKRVIANGRVYELADLVNGGARSAKPSSAPHPRSAGRGQLEHRSGDQAELLRTAIGDRHDLRKAAVRVPIVDPASIEAGVWEGRVDRGRHDTISCPSGTASFVNRDYRYEFCFPSSWSAELGNPPSPAHVALGPRDSFRPLIVISAMAKASLRSARALLLADAKIRSRKWITIDGTAAERVAIVGEQGTEEQLVFSNGPVSALLITQFEGLEEERVPQALDTILGSLVFRR